MSRVFARTSLRGALVLACLAVAAAAHAQGPGSPPAGVLFTAKLRESFSIPATQEPGNAFANPLPTPVATGVVVLKEDPNQPNDVPAAWSDIVYFTPQDPNHRTALFISDPDGRAFTDADLAPYGLSIQQIVSDPRTIYANEALPFTAYSAGGGAGFGTAHYQMYSDQDTLPPGAPLPNPTGQGFTLDIREPCGETSGQEPPTTVNLPAPCQPGFLVLMEKGSATREADTENPANWSDVVYFKPASFGGGATSAILISDSHAAGTPEGGITNADLSPFGISVNDVVEGNTVYTPETQPVTYVAGLPAVGPTSTYHVYSDADGIVISTVSWTTVNLNTVHFQIRVENPDAQCASNPIHLVASSQPFGVFQPNYGPIGTMDVPSIPPNNGGPNNFFDVFFDVPLSQLPPTAQKTWPMVTSGGGAQPLALRTPRPNQATPPGCPPDNHWDGNVDIVWSDPATGEGGHVDRHFGTLQVCPGHGASYIHLITGCSGASTVSFTGGCPGWTITLTNNDGTPAPSPLPAGWDGKISLTADASVTAGSTCCFSVLVTCNGEVAQMDVCGNACQCSDTGPNPVPSTIDWATLPGGSTVRFHVQWTDPDPSFATQPVSGMMSSQVFGVFQPDFGPIGGFNVPPISPTSFFDVFFDVPLAQLPPSAEQRVPGSAANGPCPPDNHWDGNVDLTWSGAGGSGEVNKHVGHIMVCPGSGNSYIHIVANCTLATGGQWSIVGLCPGFHATLVNMDLSPAPNPTPPGWSGFIAISADASTPVPTTCCFDVKFVCGSEVANIELCATTCNCHQPAVNPVPTQIGWTNVPGGAVRFHVRWEDPDPNVSSAEISGDMRSQDFGIFLGDHGEIAPFRVPPIAPGSFFDVFADADLSNLPAQPPKTTPGTAGGGNCPPDTTWNGNVDISWTGAGGPGVTHKHVGTVLVDAGVIPSYVHLLTGCPTGASWSVMGLCPGWTVTLVNPDLSPAPNPIPPGFTGWIKINAASSVPPGTTCCFQLVFTCGNQTGVIELCATTCAWNPTSVVGGPAVTFGIRDVIPNPTFGRTLIRYALPLAGPMKLEVFDAAGTRVRTVFSGVQAAGVSTQTWDGRNDRGDLARPGTYFIRLAQEGRTTTRKVELRP